MLELVHVSKTYQSAGGRVEALRDVSLRLAPGEFVSIIGPSGSGKTTLMNILGCLDSPSQGEYRLMGRQAGGLDPNQAARLRNQAIGFIFQSFNLAPALTALENVELPLAFRGQSRAIRRQAALEALAQVGQSGPQTLRAFRRTAAESGGGPGDRRQTAVDSGGRAHRQLGSGGGGPADGPAEADEPAGLRRGADYPRPPRRRPSAKAPAHGGWAAFSAGGLTQPGRAQTKRVFANAPRAEKEKGNQDAAD